MGKDDQVRAVVVTGAGRAFCAGGDVNLLRKARESEDVGEIEALLKTGKQIVLAIAKMPKPVVAAVNGPAAGAGANLALCCNVRIASELASFTQSFAKLGLFPDFGGTYFLPRLAGPAVATELMISAETVSAADALRMGLVSRVVPPDRLEDGDRAARRWLGRGAADCGPRREADSPGRRLRGAGEGSRRRDSLADYLLSLGGLPRRNSGVLRKTASALPGRLRAAGTALGFSRSPILLHTPYSYPPRKPIRKIAGLTCYISRGAMTKSL